RDAHPGAAVSLLVHLVFRAGIGQLRQQVDGHTVVVDDEHLTCLHFLQLFERADHRVGRFKSTVVKKSLSHPASECPPAGPSAAMTQVMAAPGEPLRTSKREEHPANRR